jgi:YVTN family beta-propeller protein
VIDVPGAKIVKTIDLGEHRRPHGVAWRRDGKRALITTEGSRSLIEVDVESGRVERAIGTGQEVSHMVAVDPAERRAFVANIGSGSVSVLDLGEARHVKDVKTGAGAEGIDVTPDGRQVWVTNRAADTVTILDASTLEIAGEVDLKVGLDPEARPFPIRAKVTPDGRHVLVSTPGAGEVVVLDAASRKVLRRVPMRLTAAQVEGRLFGGRFGESSVPIGILVPPGGRRAYVANANADAVSIIDLETWEVSGTLATGREPDGMAWSPLGVRDAAPRGSAR